MIKVLLADDEPMVRKRLRTLIDWRREGFEIIGEAEDGEEALHLALAQKPDLLITDIRMPVISGLALIEKIRRNLPDVFFIILSGYAEFGYAQEAITLGVRHYLLKPVIETDLLGILRQIQKEAAQNAAIHWKASEAEEARREKWAVNLLEGRNYAFVEDNAADFGVQLEQSNFAVLIIEIDGPEEETDEEKVDTVRECSGQAARRMGALCGNYFLVERGLWGWTLLLVMPLEAADPLPGSKIMAKIEEAARDLINTIKSETYCEATIGIGDLTRNWTHVCGCRKEAAAAMEGKFVLGRGRLIRIEDFVQHLEGESWETLFGWNSAALYEAIENNETYTIAQEIGGLFAILRQKRVSQTLTEGITLEKVVGVGRLVSKMNGSIEQAIGKEADPYRELRGMRSLEELRNWMAEFCLKIAAYIALMRSSRPRGISAKVLEIMNGRYHEEITLKSISREIYMNPVYLGQVFKSETGMAFNDCLTEIRVRTAEKLLTGSALPINEVAEQVGYKAPKNFYKAFKKIHGCTPSHYRYRVNSETRAGTKNGKG